MATTFRDNFNRPDNGWGSGWTINSDGVSFGILSNQARIRFGPTSVASGITRFAAADGLAEDQSSQAVFQGGNRVEGLVGLGVRLFFNSAPINITGYIAVKDASGGSPTKLIRCVNQRPEQGTVVGTSSTVLTTGQTLKVEIVRSVITVRINGVTVISYTDSSPLGAGKPGFAIADGVGGGVQSFDWLWDDWVGETGYSLTPYRVLALSEYGETVIDSLLADGLRVMRRGVRLSEHGIRVFDTPKDRGILDDLS